ncbi:MAG TPA: Ig-like domain-containing protein, partial [Cyclobacteriaceae bacterium]
MRGTLLITALCFLSTICFAQDPGPMGANFNGCITTGDVTWTNPFVTNTILVFAKSGSAITVGTPTNNISTYTASATFGTGTAYQNDAAAFCVYKGSGTSVNLTSLTAGTTYHFIIFNALNTVYSTASAFSGSTITTPANATGLSALAGTNDAAISWTDPASCFDEIMIVAKQGSSVSGTPSGNGSAYTANSLSFTDGANTSFGGGKVVYKGGSSSSPQTVTNLTTGQTYYFKIFTRKGTAWSAGIETSVTICNVDNASALKISDTNTTATLYWTDPTCFDEVMVVVKQGSLVSGTPSGNGSSYTANSLSYTDGSNTSFGGGVVVFKGAGGQSPKTITNLTAGNVYYFTIFARKGTTWSSGASISTATGNPLIVSVNPADGSTGVPSNQVFTITFNENVFIASGGSGAAQQVTFNQSGSDPTIPRGSTSGSPSGDGYITRTGNVVTLTLTLSGGLDLNEVNNILIGANVFKDSTGNNFAGTVAGDWNFTTTTGVSLNNPSVGACVNQYTTLGDIVITEDSYDNIVGTDNGSYTLILDFDQSGFIFKPGTSGITATVDPGGDIQSVTVSSVSFTQATFTVQFKNVSNNSQANDDFDEVTISGLKVSMDGSSPPPANILVKAASTISIQGITEDVTSLATVTSGSTPSAPTISWPSGDNSYCSGTDLTTINVSASGGTSYNWYNDAALTSVLFTNKTTRTAAQLFGASPGTGTFTKYATSVNGCESSATSVVLQITSVPTADAGSIQTVCPDDVITIGGTPTATGGSGSYTYSWTSTPAGFTSSSSNPTFNAPANSTASNAITNYSVTVQDGNLCSATDNVDITVKTTSENVVITQPSIYTYTTSNQAVNLVGSPAGGTFTGVGVVQLNGSYKFDPQSAGIGSWPVTYTATLANGCVKSFTQNFDVTAPFDVFASLQTQYCNNESPVALHINPAMVAQIQNFITTWNTVYVPTYGYSLLKPTFTGIIRNEYETYYGDNNSVQPSGATYSSGGVTLNEYYFYPSAFTTGQAYPAGGGTLGTCATCTYGYVVVYLEFASPLLTAPYNIAAGTDLAYAYNLGGVAAIAYTGEVPTINPVPVASFSGLLSSYCNVNTNYDLTGNQTGGFYEISNNGSTFNDIVGDGIKDASEGIAPGIGEFNPQAAFGGAVASTNKWIRYSIDPGTTGSTSQGCIGRQTGFTTIYPSTAITWDASVPAANTQFCYEGAAIDLKTSQGSPPSSGSVAFSGFGVADSGNGLAKFTPQTAF